MMTGPSLFEIGTKQLKGVVAGIESTGGARSQRVAMHAAKAAHDAAIQINESEVVGTDVEAD